ncbi:hypothetical protein AB0M28_04740 [Streptomyces sp. NPDC051940]|uniref:hypothetical protein n=1 Tax=Streptomyces sp. NPDC051940 TaxID=3155675 RepID=UPI00341BBC9B
MKKLLELIAALIVAFFGLQVANNQFDLNINMPQVVGDGGGDSSSGGDNSGTGEPNPGGTAPSTGPTDPEKVETWGPAALNSCGEVSNGQPCRVHGSGFKPGEAVEFTAPETGQQQGGETADDNGEFDHDFAVLSAPGRTYTVQAKGTDSGLTATVSFTLTE